MRIAKLENAELTVLFICDLGWNSFLCNDWLLGSDARADFLHWMRSKEGESANDAMDQFRKLANGFPFESIIAEGEVREELIKESAKGYDLLILSKSFNRGLERIKNPLPDIIKKSECSVLLLDCKDE